MKVARGSKYYWFIRNDKPWYDDGINKRFQDTHITYNAFQKLMHKLQQSGDGFWHNRDVILRLAQYLVIVVDDETENIVAFYTLLPSHEIVFFQVFEERKGLGRWIIDQERHAGELFVQDIVPESVLFWQKVGVPVRK
jgi:hypothetical protein